MIEIFTGLKPIQTAEELDAIKFLAKSEKHDVIAPTHVVMKNGVVVGYASLGAIPTSIYHFSKEMVAHDSFNVINIAECLVAASGARLLLAPVGKESPFHDVITNPKVGYRFLANVDLFIKELQ